MYLCIQGVGLGWKRECTATDTVLESEEEGAVGFINMYMYMYIGRPASYPGDETSTSTSLWTNHSMVPSPNRRTKLLPYDLHLTSLIARLCYVIRSQALQTHILHHLDCCKLLCCTVLYCTVDPIRRLYIIYRTLHHLLLLAPCPRTCHCGLVLFGSRVQQSRRLKLVVRSRRTMRRAVMLLRAGCLWLEYDLQYSTVR